jgi:hypothetical protein
MGLSDRTRPWLEALAAAALAALIGLAAARAGLSVDVVRKAAGIPDSADGVGKFINGAHALVLPLLVMAAAISPLALIGGGILVLFGSRRGIQIVVTSLGVLLLLGSVTALVD